MRATMMGAQVARSRESRRWASVAAMAVAVVAGVLLALMTSVPGASATTTVDFEVTSAIAGPNPVWVGNDLAYTVKVRKNSGALAEAANLKVTVGSTGVRFAESRTGTACTGKTNKDLGTYEVNCRVDNLAAGRSRTIVVVVTPTTSGRKLATAQVQWLAGTRDLNPSNDKKEVQGPTKEPGTEVKGRSCTVRGTPGDDTGANALVGTNPSATSTGIDVICGLGGNDEIYGLGGNDEIYGGSGGSGTLRIDKLYGGSGADLFRGGPDDDYITGGAGTDTVSYEDAQGGISVNLYKSGTAGYEGEAFDPPLADEIGDPIIDPDTGDKVDADGRDALIGNDQFVDDIDNVKGSSYNDFIVGSDELDNTFWGLSGNDTMDGRGGVDTVAYDYSRSAVTVDLSLVHERQDTGEGIDTLQWKEKPTDPNIKPEPSIESVRGSNWGDTLKGGPGANVLTGGLGNDTLDSRDGVSGNDSLDGGDGDDECLRDTTELSVQGCER